MPSPEVGTILRHGMILGVGDASMRKDLEQEIADRDLEEQVRLHGHHASVDQLMCCWDLFVLGSKSEGVPMSLLEAMRAGTTCVCTAVGGIPEVIRDGETGRLVPTDDPSRLAEAIGALLQDAGERRRLALGAQGQIESRFSVSAMTGRYLEVYRSCLEDVESGRAIR